jgi:predicted secreted protein
MKKCLWLASLILFTCGTSSPAAVLADGHDGVTYDRVQLSVSASRVVVNDLSVATLYVERDGKTQLEVSAAINEAMAWALAEARKSPGIKLETTQYSTWPVHSDNGTTLTGWRARQSLRLEAADGEKLAALVTALQERLAVESIGFSVSAARQASLEEELTREALQKFETRASQVAETLGRPGYRLMRVELGNTGGMSPPIHYRGVMAMADRAMAAAPVQMEAGEQTLTVTASGLIQLDSRP